MIVLLAFAVSAVISQQSKPQLVSSLPNWSNANGPLPTMYTGYINVNATFGRNIFYWLVEADTNPSSAPLMFWFQGGPGAAGEYGLTFEMGNIAFGGTVSNPIVYRRTVGAWTKYVNMVFLDQPAGVGFSYSTNTADYALNSDTRSAHDNKVFLDVFFQLLPQYKKNPFYLAGESYGGVYVPMLANLTAYDAALTTNFAGILVGNPVFRCTDNEIGTSFEIVNLFYWHGYVSHEDMQSFWAQGCDDAAARTGFEKPACLSLANRINSNAYLGADFDPDNQFQDACTSNATLQFLVDLGPSGACVNSYANIANAYFARQDVASAIHAKLPNARPNWNYAMDTTSQLPFYAPLIAQQKSILVYSGDIDIQTVPFAYTMACLARLPNRGVRTMPWTVYTQNGVTIGRFEQYEAYTYATLRGGGHEVPGYQPIIAESVLQRWLVNGTLIDQSNSARTHAASDTLPPNKASFIGLQKQSQLLKWNLARQKK